MSLILLSSSFLVGYYFYIISLYHFTNFSNNNKDNVFYNKLHSKKYLLQVNIPWLFVDNNNFEFNIGSISGSR